MTAAPDAERAPTRWQRHVERLVFGIPVAFGATFLLVAVADGDAAVANPIAAMADPTAFVADATALIVGAIVLVVVALIWTVALAAAVYLDADAVEAGDVGWEPNGAAYAAFVLVVPVAALHYLYARYRHVRPPPGSGRWWYAIPATTLVLLAPFVAVALAAVPPETVLVGYGLAMAVLPPAVFRDAAYLRSVDAGWRPDPTTHLVFALLSTLVVVAQPLYVGYYLARRWRATGRR